MRPKGKTRLKRRSRRLAGLIPMGNTNAKKTVVPQRKGIKMTHKHEDAKSEQTETESSTTPSRPCTSLDEVADVDTPMINLPSTSAVQQPMSTVNDSDHPDTDSDITDFIRFVSASSSQSLVSSQSSGVSDSRSSTTSQSQQSAQSPNTNLLISNLVPSSPTSSAQQTVSLARTRRSVQTSDSDRPRSSSSNADLVGSRTISLRSRRRRGQSAQARAIVSAYRSIPSSLPVKGESYCDCPKTSRDLTCSCGEEDTAFEWSWDALGKSAACDLSDENRTAIFHVSYSSGTAAVKGSQPMSDRQYFWEVKMTSPVYGTDMMVGIGTSNVNLDSFRHTFTSLLGRDGDSWGLSYYGRFQQKGQFRPIAGAKFGQGSIIGLHVDMWRGTLSYYKNRKPLGVLCSGLHGKVVFPMVASTAARTTMKIIKACSFQTSLQFLCCQALRKMVPSDMNVTDVVGLPPGLKAFLANNLSWLLRPNELQADIRTRNKKRPHEEVEAEYRSSSSEEDRTDRRDRPPKRFRFGTGDISDGTEDEEDELPVDLALSHL